MDPTRFDRLTAALASRPLTRRRTVTAGTALLGGLLGFWRGAGAQSATPPTTATPASSALAANNSTLFVQTAATGTFQPNPAAHATPTVVGPGTPAATTAHGAYVLSLQGHSGQTIAFSDRPQRKYAEVETPRFFTSMGFTAVNPPNAALVADSPQQQDDVLLVELLNPAYDDDRQTLTYEANILTGYQGEGLKALASKQQDQQIAAHFTNAALFIDDCPDATLYCLDTSDGQIVGSLGDTGMCWSWPDFQCEPCNGGWPGAWGQCDNTFDVCREQGHGPCQTTE